MKHKDAAIKFVAANPGATCDDIARCLTIAPRELRYTLRALRSKNLLRSEGNTRGTRYWIVWHEPGTFNPAT